jgi:hypothetical protein
MEDLDRQIAEACARLAPRLGPEPIIAVACIRDEQDVVERFVRHNLAVVDALVVVNHPAATRHPPSSTPSWRKACRSPSAMRACPASTRPTG